MGAGDKKPKNPLQAVVFWIRKQPPKVKTFLGVVAGLALLVFLRLVVSDHDNLFVAAEAVHAIGISVLIYKLTKEKNCAGWLQRHQTKNPFASCHSLQASGSWVLTAYDQVIAVHWRVISFKAGLGLTVVCFPRAAPSTALLKELEAPLQNTRVGALLYFHFAGLSLKSQELTAAFLGVRLYCSLVMEKDIHTVLDLLTLIATAWVIYTIRYQLWSSYSEEMDNMPNYYVVR